MKASCPLFELRWTNITKKAMSPITVAKYPDVFEHIGMLIEDVRRAHTKEKLTNLP
jgi:hypothetical protein